MFASTRKMSNDSAPAFRERSGAAPDDWALVARLRAGDEAALEQLLERHWPEVVAFAARILGSTDAAEDVAQGVFIRLWERRDGWKPTGSFRHLLLRITRNLALNERRRRARYARRFDDRFAQEPAAPGTPLAGLAERELRSAVERAVQALPERRREVFVLSRFHNLSHREIAEVMGISPQTVANQMSAALAELRRSLSPYLD